MELRHAIACHERRITSHLLRSVTQARPSAPWLAAAPTRGRRDLTSLARNRYSQRSKLTINVLDSPRRHASSIASPPADAPVDLKELHFKVNEMAWYALDALNAHPPSLPSDKRIVEVLEHFDTLITYLQQQYGDNSIQVQRPQTAPGQTATSALLGSVNASTTPAQISKTLLLKNISAHAERILRHEAVSITVPMVSAYVDLQCRLQAPSSLPDIFNLYRTKPLASLQGKTSQVVLTDAPEIWKKAAAIPPSVAAKALDCAIAAHDLACAIDIVETAYSTEAAQNFKILREAGLPLVGFITLPVALWGIASHIGSLSPALSHEVGTNVAFAGIMTYVSAVGMLGYVTITTSNDQMKRVTWAQGIPLWERWTRESERAAIDKIAQAWGFKDDRKKGEEVGEEWLYLKEWVGMKSMVLDRISLMEGME